MDEKFNQLTELTDFDKFNKIIKENNKYDIRMVPNPVERFHVYIEGIEFDFSNINIVAGENNITIQISFPPYMVMTRIPPMSWVQVTFEDETGKEVLIADGVVSGYAYNKTAISHSVSINVEGIPNLMFRIPYAILNNGADVINLNSSMYEAMLTTTRREAGTYIVLELLDFFNRNGEIPLNELTKFLKELFGQLTLYSKYIDMKYGLYESIKGIGSLSAGMGAAKLVELQSYSTTNYMRSGTIGGAFYNIIGAVSSKMYCQAPYLKKVGKNKELSMQVIRMTANPVWIAGRRVPLCNVLIPEDIINVNVGQDYFAMPTRVMVYPSGTNGGQIPMLSFFPNNKIARNLSNDFGGDDNNYLSLKTNDFLNDIASSAKSIYENSTTLLEVVSKNMLLGYFDYVGGGLWENAYTQNTPIKDPFLAAEYYKPIKMVQDSYPLLNMVFNGLSQISYVDGDSKTTTSEVGSDATSLLLFQLIPGLKGKTEQYSKERLDIEKQQYENPATVEIQDIQKAMADSEVKVNDVVRNLYDNYGASYAAAVYYQHVTQAAQTSITVKFNPYLIVGMPVLIDLNGLFIIATLEGLTHTIDANSGTAITNLTIIQPLPITAEAEYGTQNWIEPNSIENDLTGASWSEKYGVPLPWVSKEWFEGFNTPKIVNSEMFKYVLANLNPEDKNAFNHIDLENEEGIKFFNPTYEQLEKIYKIRKRNLPYKSDLGLHVRINQETYKPAENTATAFLLNKAKELYPNKVIVRDIKNFMITNQVTSVRKDWEQVHKIDNNLKSLLPGAWQVMTNIILDE